MRRLVGICVVIGAAVAAAAAYAAFFSTSSVGSSSFSSNSVFCTNAGTDTYSTSIADTTAELDKPAPAGSGTATTMTITADKSGGTKSKRILVAFGSGSPPWSYSRSLGHNCSITSATLTLYTTAGATGQTLGAFNATGSWDEATLYQIGSNTPGSSGTAATTSSVASGTITFNVTSLVQSQYTGSPGQNYGFWVKDQNEGGGAGAVTQTIATREDSTSSHRPQLSITYGG